LIERDDANNIFVEIALLSRSKNNLIGGSKESSLDIQKLSISITSKHDRQNTSNAGLGENDMCHSSGWI
jgi:hypothetical protein